MLTAYSLFIAVNISWAFEFRKNHVKEPNQKKHKHTAKKLVGEVVDFALYLNSCSGAFNKLELLYFERTAY